MRKKVDQQYVYSALTYEIIGAAQEVHNFVGPGRPEKTYQKLLAKELSLRKIAFHEQVSIDLIYKGEKVGKRRVDFMVENKLILELKVGSHIGKGEIEQLYEYIKMMDMKLGLIIFFSRDVKVRRIVNIR